MSVEVLKQIWPEWQIEGKPLGKGSFSVVYKAVRRDHNVESYAAIKVISIPADPSEVDSLRSEGLDMNATRTYLQGIVNDFVSEIQLMESLKGVQNIVSVEDYKVVEKSREIGWDIYIRMELLTSFNTYICDKKLTEEEVIKLGCDICTALEICAKRNIIHRDIKPENIFINDFGYFKLGDFGIARKMENMTGGLSQKGTFNYMAPEVANSSDYDARVDTYSLGIVLYRLLNGNRLPFLDTEKQLLNPNERRNAVNRRLRGEDLPAPCDASPAMADLILRACAYDPNMRFASATEMKQALMSVANGTYQIGASNLDRTTSVRKAAGSYDRTTSVRKAPAVSNQKSAPTVNTFGSQPKKKSKMPAVIAAVLAVMLLVGADIFAVPKLLDGNDSAEPGETSGQTTSETADYSKFDEEQIASIISEADALAAEEDYEGALVKVQTGLATYPKSAELQDKSDEYTEALNAQVKVETLDEAKTLADSGDYVSAIALIKNAQETQDDDVDYQTALKTYSTAYKTEVIASADTLAANGDCIGALEAVETASAVIGDDTELSAKATEYENAYVEEVCAEADALVSNDKHDEATTLLNNALTIVKDNGKLKNKLTSVDAQRPKPLVDILQPYQSNDYESFANGVSVVMGGIKRYNGFTLDVYGWNGQSCAIYNLNKEYTKLTGMTGYVDGRTGDGKTWDVNIYADDRLVYTCTVSPGDLPQEFSIDVTGVTKLEFRAGSTNGFSGYIGFAELEIKGSNQQNSTNDSPSSENTANLVDILQPYDSNDYEVFANGASVMMGGIKRYNGFALDVYGWNGQSCAVYNLNKEYTKLTGMTSYIDGRIGDGKTWDVSIYADDKLVFTCTVSPGDLPQEFSIDVTGVTKLEFRAGSTNGFSGYIGFAELKIC